MVLVLIRRHPQPQTLAFVQPITSNPLTSNQLITVVWAAMIVLAGIVITTMLRIDDDLTVFLPSDGAP